MIKICGDSLVVNDISKLIRGKPVDMIFESLNEIWIYSWFNFAEYYSQGEKLTSKFEEFFFHTYPEVYDTILEDAMRNGLIPEILSKDCFCLIIMDGMSIREVIPLLEDFKKYGNVRYEYSYSAIPSGTGFFTKRYFGTSSPSQMRSNDKFRFYHIQRADNIDDISLDRDKLIVWSTYPDSSFSQFNTEFETHDMQNVLNRTKNTLFKLLHRLSSYKEIIITSDHGYFIDTFSWEGIHDFPNNERYSCYVPESLKRYCKKFNDYWILVGRYNAIKRGKYSHVRHGGLSFLETIVPLIEIKI